MDIGGNSGAPSPLIPAATVLLLRNTDAAMEVLLLRRNRALKAFGGAWVFPGGRVDSEDGPGLNDIERAKVTALRETMEETSLDIAGANLATLSNWIPPVEEKRRFSTWFFVGKAPDSPVKIDEGEIHDYQWIAPQAALDRIPSSDFLVFPPTYVSLHAIKDFTCAEDAVSALTQQEPEVFETRFGKGPNGFITLWPGDTAYNDLNFDKPGPRRRLTAEPTGWRYETTI